MKKITLYIALMLVFIMLVPAILAQLIHKEQMKHWDFTGKNINVWVHTENKAVEMPFELYLVGVVSAEMPANFGIEALKAQAVAARTYAIYHIKNDNQERKAVHHGADVCTNFAHCNAWISEEESKKRWGKQWTQYHDKISQAVTETKGVYMTYQDQPINAVFFAMSSGKTENAKDVWGSEIPYLKSVDSAGEEKYPNFNTQLEVGIDDFRKKLSDYFKNEKKAADDPNALMAAFTPGQTALARSDGGSVSAFKIGNTTLGGKELRSLFGLRSANFTIEQKDNKIIFNVKGYGHGVGLSQYGAAVLADSGKSYEEILKHYYTGIQIQKN